MSDSLVSGTTSPPMMPDDYRRAVYQAARLTMLREDHRALLSEYVAQTVGDEQMSAWLGSVSIASNPLASVMRQLATPGLYGRRPVVGSLDPGLTDVGGLMDGSRYWTMAQQMEYFTRGLGDLLVEGRVVGGVLVWRLVWPHLIHEERADDGRIVRLDELRQRFVGAEWVWAWDRYDVSDPAAPSFRVVLAAQGTVYGEDATPPALAGPYAWVDSSGVPYVPYVHRAAVDDGCIWHERHMAGLHEGTLFAGLLETITRRVAVFASGEHTFLGGIDPASLAGTVQSSRGELATGVPSRSMPVTPGTVTALVTLDGQSLSSVKIGPGASLDTLGMYQAQHGVRLATAAGLDVPDVMRQTANPTSGAALAISRETRREMAAQYREIAARSDIEALTLASRLLGRGVPEGGYVIEYREIPRTPTEEAERRADIEWRIEQGMMSRVDGYMALHPGVTRDAAVVELARIAADNKLIAAKSPPGGSDGGQM